MDAQVLTGVGFTQAAVSLSRLRRPDFGEVALRLEGAKKALECMRILQEFDPSTWSEYHSRGLDLLDEDTKGVLVQDTLNAIDEIAPLYWEPIEADDEDSGPYMLYPRPMGMPMNWDEWADMVSEPENYLSEDAGPWAFYSALRQDSEEAFDSFNEYFNWELVYPTISNGKTLDLKKMFRLLDKHGLGAFKAVWNVADYSTGNIYFDYNIYDDNEPLPDFSVEGVRELRAAYQAAQPILEEYRAAVRLWQREENIKWEVLKIFVRSLVKEKDAPKRPQTLAEIFTQEVRQARNHPATTAIGADEENDETDPLGVLEGRRSRTRVRTDGRIDEAHLTDVLTDGGPELGDVLAQLREINREINQTTRQFQEVLNELLPGEEQGEQIIDPFYGPLTGDFETNEEDGDGNDDND